MTARALIGCAALTLAACASLTEPDVQLEPVGVVTIAEAGFSTFTADRLAVIGPDEVPDGSSYQVISLMGREDLIPENEGDFRARRCAPWPGDPDPIKEIVRRAETQNVVIINEGHGRSLTRAVVEDVLIALKPLGFEYYAAESFAHYELNADFYDQWADEAYHRDSYGYYIREAQFGRTIRTAKRLGYKLVGYEATGDQRAPEGSHYSVGIDYREEGQANNLIAYVLGEDPNAKIIIHVGYSHAREVPDTSEYANRWMAMRLKRKTGIDPLTISQTSCAGAPSLSLRRKPSTTPDGTFDLFINMPPAEFVRGRNAWRLERGDIAVSIPSELMPTEGWHIIEARPIDEPNEAVPMDRVAVRPQDKDVALMLPPGEYRVRAVAVPPKLPVDKPDQP